MLAPGPQFICDTPGPAQQASQAAKTCGRTDAETGPGRGRVQNRGASFPPAGSSEVEKQQIRASDRLLLYALIRRLLRPTDGSRGPSTAACGLPRDADEAIALLKRGEGRISVSGVYRCRSPWLCPVCAPAAAKERQEKLQKVVDAAPLCAMVTLTIRHQAQDALAKLKELVSSSSRCARQGRVWQEIKERGSILGVVQGVEVLWSRRHGWHFHLHLLLVSESSSKRAVLRAGRSLIKRYRQKVAERGGVARRIGQDVRIVSNGNYPAKGSAAWEVAGGLKSGFGELITPWDIAILAHIEDPAGVAAWREYASEMPGTQSCRVSPQLAKALDLDLGEDEGGEEQDEAGEVIGTISAPIWSRLRRFGQGHRPIRLAEDGAEWPQIDRLVRELDAEIRAAFDDPIADAPEYARHSRPAAQPVAAPPPRSPTPPEPPPIEPDYDRVARIAAISPSSAKGLLYGLNLERREALRRGRDFQVDEVSLQRAVVAAAEKSWCEPAMGGKHRPLAREGQALPVDPSRPPPIGGMP